ncbi:hypothetical protein K505DRAFT_348193 [Melanomma pulvis-pyrius CBS 109.77]|uniref:Uncharacterized protein n=1 Tax=Melanomma pulvis-pyrius CBS 109.77 TaxID=1314802 RepID=A0A6A6XKJ3_9PLEO|nr:hypothetical protein K505DRAFT_348193 [Melanomma pulvis-pyrius CBS 109.77]
MNEYAVDPADGGIQQNPKVVASLVHTLIDTFGSASSLYRRLKRERKAEESDDSIQDRRHVPLSRRRLDSDTDSDFRDRRRRRLGRSKSRKGERSRSRSKSRHRDAADSDEEAINAASELVLAEYERGHHYLGEKYAVGDRKATRSLIPPFPPLHACLQPRLLNLARTVLAQTQLQAQIIALQQTLLQVYQAYALTPQHLPQLLHATRSARIASIQALATQYQRMLEIPDTFPLPDLPGAFPARASEPHGLPIRSKSRTRAKSIDSSSNRTTRFTPSSSHSAPTAASRGLFCVYASDLQKYADQPLADSYRAEGDGRCPYCHFVISTRPSKAWEIVKEDEAWRDRERVFLVQQRFIVKCHREGGRFACVVCSKFRETDTVCGEARALVDHLWREHTCVELERDEDVVEVGMKPC